LATVLERDAANATAKERMAISMLPELEESLLVTNEISKPTTRITMKIGGANEVFFIIWISAIHIGSNIKYHKSLGIKAGRYLTEWILHYTEYCSTRSFTIRVKKIIQHRATL
jgi:hypothetical protein